MGKRASLFSTICLPGALAFAQAAFSQQGVTPQEPKWLDLNISRAALGVRVEGEHDTTTFGSGGSKVTYSRLFIGPEVGLDLAGSVFHPNFARLSLVSDSAYGQSWQTVRSSTGSRTTEEMLFLGNYHFRANFLDPKPYRGSVFVDQNNSYRDNDFYSRVFVESVSFGAQALYENDNWRASTDYVRRDEHNSGGGTGSTTISDNLNLNLSNIRKRGTTTFSYAFSHYDFSGINDQQSSTENHAISLSDREEFGSRDQFTLNSRVGYSRTDYTRDLGFADENEQLTGGVDLNAVHSSTLRSDYSVTADRYESGNVENLGVGGSATLTHQLFQSLSSSLTAFGNNSDYSDLNSEGYMRRVGVTWAESYRKNLGGNHTLNLNNSLTFSGTSQQGIATIENESHTFSTATGNPIPDAFFLNQLNVVRSTIRVYDASKSQLYQEGLAYTVIVNGAQTIIERRQGVGIGGIPEGSTVLVDYEAEPTADGDYTTIGENFRIRLDLWGRLWAIYAGYASSSSSAGEEFGVLNFIRLNAGTEVNWKALSAGAEVESYDSDQSKYESLGLFQGVSVRLSPSSSLGANLSERWIRYLDADAEESQYRLNAQYNNQILDRLRLDTQAGVSYRTGRFEDETLAAIRPTLHYRYGKTTMSLAYTSEYSLTGTSNERLRHMLRLVATRRF